jgi:hypothetical protein
MALARIAEFADFQAEYEGSIPFTRCNAFNGLTRQEFFILTSRVFPF